MLNRPRWHVAGLGWALWLLTLLGLAATLLIDAMQRDAGGAELVTYSASSIPLVVAVASAVTVGLVLAARRPRHPVGWLLLGLGLSQAVHGLT
ncbi:MAG TPA: hypothetical protein VG409_03325, partial [Actinomycetota bacterium]|nr:hypothetical protein [Actinomycetota bacterium]